MRAPLIFLWLCLSATWAFHFKTAISRDVSLGASGDCTSTSMADDQSRGKVIARYQEKTPLKLFRICGRSKKVVLRDRAAQEAKGLMSFDITLGLDGLASPAPEDGTYIGPNGASLRSIGSNMYDLVEQRRGATNIVEIPQGIDIPDGLVIIREHGDHYSLQCTKGMKLPTLHQLMDSFLAPFEFYSREEYLRRYPVKDIATSLRE